MTYAKYFLRCLARGAHSIDTSSGEFGTPCSPPKKLQLFPSQVLSDLGILQKAKPQAGYYLIVDRERVAAGLVWEMRWLQAARG